MENNFDLKKYLVENKLTSNSRMLNEDNLEVKNFAKQIYSFLVKNDVTTKLIASIPSAGSQGKQIGDKLTGGSNEGLVWYWDDPKTKQTVIEIHLAGGEKGVLEVEKKILSSFPNLEQYNRETPSGPDVFKVRFRVKEKTTAKGGLVGNTNEGYYDDIAGYTSVSDNGTGFKDNDKVKSKSGQEGVVYDVLKSKEGKALVVVKFQNNGNTAIAKYGEGFSDINDISK
jgi:hypothetical protein